MTSRGEAFAEAVKALQPQDAKTTQAIARLIFSPPGDVHEIDWTADNGRQICKCGKGDCPQMPQPPPPPRDAHKLSWVAANGRRICICGKGDCGWEAFFKWR